MKRVKDVKQSPDRAARLIAAVCVASGALLFSQRLALDAQQQPPVFRSKVEVVQLDVSVLDNRRRPVRGLTQEDFTILEDGKPRKIVGFTAFDIGDEGAAVSGWMRDVPDVTTNDLEDSRLFVIVMDDGLIPQDPFAIKSSRDIARSIIDKLAPDDLAAVVFTGDNRKSQDFTKDKTKLIAAIDNFNPGLAGYMFGLGALTMEPARGRGEAAGGGPPIKPVDVDLWFYQSAIRTLSSVADFLIAAPGRRKALMWISPGVPLDIANCVPIDPRSPTPPICVPGGLPPAEAVELTQRTDAIFRMAQRANVTIYPIDPTGLGGMANYIVSRIGVINRPVANHKATMQQDFLVAAAANTGGRTVLNINEFEPGIRDIFAENASYYLIAFEPGNTEADGKLHRIQVKVNREDVEIRTRSGYYAPKPEEPKTRKAEASPESAALAKSIGGLLPTSDLPMKVVLAPFAVPGRRQATVAIVLGVKEPVPEAAAKGRIDATTELQISAFTPEGDPRGTQRHTAKVTLRAGSGGDAEYEVLGKIDLPAGRYRLRLAAHSVASKKDGSVFADVIVPDYSNLPVSASPIVLAATPAKASAPKDLLKSVLPFVPTAGREFTITDRVTAFLRLYQNGAKAGERATVNIRIRNAQDRVLVDGSQTIAAEAFVVAGQKLLADAPTSEPGRLGQPRVGVGAVPPPATTDQFANLSLRSADVSYAIPLVGLRPGPHLLTMEVTMGPTVIRRDIRFQVLGSPGS